MGHKWYCYTTWPVDTQDKILRIHDKYEVELTHMVLGYKPLAIALKMVYTCQNM